MKIKNLLLLTILAAGYAPQSNAMYRPIIQKASSSISAFLAKIAKGAANHTTPLKNPLSAYFYGALVMQNPDTKKTVILLPDVHVFIRRNQGMKCAPKNLALAQKQQTEIINLAQELERQGEKIHIIVEDKVEDQADIFTKQGGTISPGCLVGIEYIYSPLVLLKKLSENNNILCTNIEFRDAKNLKNQQEIKNQIRNKVDAAILQKLYSHYSIIGSGDDNKNADLDAAILNTIQENNASSIMIVCAGGFHTASISKILYQQGYSSTYVKAPEYLPSDCTSSLYDFANNKPLPEARPEMPPHLPDITNNVLGAMAELKQQRIMEEPRRDVKQQQQRLKKLTSQLYAASNLFS